MRIFARIIRAWLYTIMHFLVLIYATIGLSSMQACNYLSVIVEITGRRRSIVVTFTTPKQNKNTALILVPIQTIIIGVLAPRASYWFGLFWLISIYLTDEQMRKKRHKKLVIFVVALRLSLWMDPNCGNAHINSYFSARHNYILKAPINFIFDISIGLSIDFGENRSTKMATG